MSIKKKIKNILHHKKRLKKITYWGLGFLGILFILFFVRGCSSNPISRKKVYHIGRDSILQVDLLGRERNLIAFTNDLIANIAVENKLIFQWIETNSSHLIEGLDNGSYDFILTSIRPTIINQDHFDLSELVFDMGPVLIVRQDSQITSLKEMGTKPIGVSYGFTINFNAVKTPGMNIYKLSLVYYNNMNRALDDLSNNYIDGVIMPAVPAYAITQGLYAGKLKVVTSPFNDEGFRFASLKSLSLEEIIHLINASIIKMRQDGTYLKLIEKWNLVDAQSQYWHPSQENNGE